MKRNQDQTLALRVEYDPVSGETKVELQMPHVAYLRQRVSGHGGGRLRTWWIFKRGGEPLNDNHAGPGHERMRDLGCTLVDFLRDLAERARANYETRPHRCCRCCSHCCREGDCCG